MTVEINPQINATRLRVIPSEKSRLDQSQKSDHEEYIKSLIYSSLKLSQKMTASWYVYIKNQIVLLPGELSCPVDTFDSSSQDNLQSTRTSEVQVQLNHYAEN